MNTERITDNVSSSVKAFSNMAKITKVDDKRVYYELSSCLDYNFIGFHVKLNHYNANMEGSTKTVKVQHRIVKYRLRMAPD